jgi:hypothetical protein
MPSSVITKAVTEMKAMSIKQPWVHAILHEGKDIENRSWQRSFRGWVAIHASAKPLHGNRFPRGGSPVPDLKTLDYSAMRRPRRGHRDQESVEVVLPPRRP